MKIYLAGRYSRRRELAEYANDLEALGYEVTSRWLSGSHGLKRDPNNDTERGKFAAEDVEDVQRCDILIAFTEESDAGGSAGRGGRHVEFGLALALKKEIWIVGPRENVFHCLPFSDCFPSWELALQYARLIRDRLARGER